MSEEQQPTLRNWSEISEDEQKLIKLFYLNGETLATCARIWQLNYHSLRNISVYHKWHKERENPSGDILSKEAAFRHMNFMLKVFDMMERIHSGYSELLDRHQFHDQFQSFPFENYYKFLEMYAKSVDLLGGVKTVSQEVTMFLQQNNLNVQNNVANGNGKTEGDDTVIPLHGREAKNALTKLLQGVILRAKPPESKEITAEVVDDADKPDPAQGKFR